jgi:hypothetical protein
MSTAQRAHFISVALMVFIGIWLTGFDKVHWFLYVPVIALTFAGITGICLGLIFWKKVGLK